MTIETLAPWIAGAVGVPLVNLLKSWLNADGKAAVLLTSLVSALLAFLALVLTGGLTGESLVANAAKVFAAATLIYKLLA